MIARREIRRGPLLALLAGAVVVAGVVGRSRWAAPACPEGTRADPARGEAVLRRLGSAAEGAAIRARAPAPRAYCVGPRAVSVVTSDGALLVDERLGEAEAAARVGHLLLHTGGDRAVDALDRPGDRACAALVAAALDEEARALAVELSLRRALGVTAPVVRFAFEEDPRDAEAGRIRAWLDAHPDGGPGVDALAAGYDARCRAVKVP